VEAFVESERNANGCYWAGGDVEGIEHDEIGAVLGSTTDDREQPTIAFRSVCRSRDEEWLFRGLVGPGVVVGDLVGLVVAMTNARERRPLWSPFEHRAHFVVDRAEVVLPMAACRLARIDRGSQPMLQRCCSVRRTPQCHERCQVKRSVLRRSANCSTPTAPTV
jgi:hypothetical protein